MISQFYVTTVFGISRRKYIRMTSTKMWISRRIESKTKPIANIVFVDEISMFAVASKRVWNWSTQRYTLEFNWVLEACTSKLSPFIVVMLEICCHLLWFNRCSMTAKTGSQYLVTHLHTIFSFIDLDRNKGKRLSSIKQKIGLSTYPELVNPWVILWSNAGRIVI